jgi:undecaprenyl-diphosphatase
MKNISTKNPLTALFTVHVFLGMLTSIGCLFLFLKLAEDIFNKEIANFDLSIMHFFYSLRTPPLTSLMFGFTFLASTPFLTVTSICILLFFLYKKKWGEMILFFTLFYMGVLLNLLLKALFNIPRPTISPLIHENFASFPSGHSMNGFIFYFSLVYLFYHFTKNKLLTILFFILATILVLGIGISRIYLGVHFPTDVLGGYIAGLCWMSSLLLFEHLIPLFTRKGDLQLTHSL